MMASDAAWRMLHPASVAVNLLPQTWRVVRGLWPLALALLWRGSAEDGTDGWVTLLDLGIVGLFFLLTVGGTLRHWLTLRYRIAGGRLEIRTGWLNRQVRTIDPARVQDVELVRTLPHRVSGLVEVRIQTASGSEVEGLLSALTVEEAERIRATLENLREAGRAREGEVPPARELVRHGPVDLFIHAATAMRLGAAAVALGLLFEGMTWVAPEQLDTLPVRAAGWQGLGVAVAVLAGAWLVGLVGTMLRHWGFRLSRTYDGLVVEGGLTTRRRLELPLSKVQVVQTSEPLLRRLIGMGSLTVETASARSGEGGTEQRSALVPLVPRDGPGELTCEAVPDLDVDLQTAILRRPHDRALIRNVARRIVQVVVGTALASLLLGPWALPGLLLAPVLGVLAWLDWRHQGWLVSPRTVVARRGWLHRRGVVVSRSKIQSVSARQGLLMRRLGLAEVVVRVAGSAVSLPLMDWDEARRVVEQLAATLPAPVAPTPDTEGSPDGPDLPGPEVGWAIGPGEGPA